MKGKVNCTCGWSWNKSDSSAKDMYICHECGRDNSNNMKNGGWLDNIPQAQEGSTTKDKPKLGAGKYYTTTSDIVDWGTPEYERAYNRGEVLTEEGGRSEVTVDMGVLPELVLQNNYKNGFWKNYRNKIVEENKDAGLLAAIIGVPINAVTSLPQLALMNSLTGKVQRPSEWLDIKNPYGAMAVDAIADPTNLTGVGLLTKEKALAKLSNLKNINAEGKIFSGMNNELNNIALKNTGNISKNLEDLTHAKDWAKQYGYELPENLERIAQSDELTNRTVRGMMNRHNTFVRGVSTNWDVLAEKNPEILRHLEGKGFDLSTKEGSKQAAEYMATHVPIQTGYGRASLNQEVFERGQDAIYTSNSIPTAEGYTYGQGYVTKVKRPTDFSSSNRQDWITQNNPEYYKNALPSERALTVQELESVVDYKNLDNFLKEGRIDRNEYDKLSKYYNDSQNIKTELYKKYNIDNLPKSISDFTPEQDKLFDSYMEELNAAKKNIRNEVFNKQYNNKILRTERKILNDITFYDDLYKVYNKFPGAKEKFGEFIKENNLTSKILNSSEADPWFRKFVAENNYLTNDNPYAHYLHIGTPGEKMLEPIKSWEITPDIWKNKSRAHTNAYSKKLSALEDGGWLDGYDKAQEGTKVKYGTPEYEEAYNRGEVVTDEGGRSPILLDEVVVPSKPLTEFGKTRKEIAAKNKWEDYAQKYLGNFEKNMGQTLENLPESRKQEYEDYINKLAFDEYIKTHPQAKGEDRGEYIDRMQTENANSSNFERAYEANADYNDATDVNKWRKGLIGLGSLVLPKPAMDYMKQESDYFSKKEKQAMIDNPISTQVGDILGTIDPLSIPVEGLYGEKSFGDIASGESADIPMSARILGDPLMLLTEGAPLINAGLKTAGRVLNAEKGLLSNAYKINPWATKIDDAVTKIVGEGKNSFIYDPAKPMYHRTFESTPNFLTGYKQIKKPNQLDFSSIIDPRTEEFKNQALSNFKTLTGGKGDDIDLEQFVDYFKKEQERQNLKWQYQDFLSNINREKYYDTPEWQNVWDNSRDQADDIFSKIEEELLQKNSPLGKRLGSGAEGSVYELADDPNNVIKIGNTFKTSSADDLVKSFEGITDDNIARVLRAHKDNRQLIEIMPNLNANAKFSNFTKEQVLGKLEKDARTLMDKGFRLDVDNINGNFRYNPDKNKVDIYDISKPAAGQTGQDPEAVLRILRDHFDNAYRIPGTHPSYDHNMPTPEFRQGGIIKDDRGQWDHPGEVTRISGGNITMKRDPKTGKALTEPILGIADTGEEQWMYPGQDYQFQNAEYVTEYPMAQDGIKQELNTVAKDNTSVYKKERKKDKVIVPGTPVVPVSKGNWLNKLITENITPYGYWTGSPSTVAPNKKLNDISWEATKKYKNINDKYGYKKEITEEGGEYLTPKFKNTFSKINNVEAWRTENKKVRQEQKAKILAITKDADSGKPVKELKGPPRPETLNASQDALNLNQGMPQKYNSFVYSEYKPSKSTNENSQYYSLASKYEDEIKQDLFERRNADFIKSKETFRQVKNSHIADASLKDYQYSKGKDEKGDYIAYYDVNNYGNILDVLPNSNSFEIYGRIYYDKKTGKPIPKQKNGGEFPMAKNGLRQEQKGLVNLDQLTNFTNYNKPQPGGWLSKYE